MTASRSTGLAARLRERFDKPGLRRVLPNTGWLLADRVLRMVIGITVGAWVARYLGPRDYGLLSFALAWVALFTPFAALAHERVVVRDLVASPDRTHAVLGSAAALRGLGGVAAYAAAVLGMMALRPHDALALQLVMVTAVVMILQPFNVIELWYQSQVRARDAVLALAVASLLTAALRVALIVSKAQLPAFAWATVAEAALVGVMLVAVYQTRERGLGTWRAALAEGRSLLRDTAPLLLTGGMIQIYMRIDQVMLGQMASAAELGAYSAAVRLVEAWYFLPTAVVASVFPTIVEAQRSNPALFYERLQRLYGATAALAYAIALPTCLLSGWIVRVLFGAEYAHAAPMLAVLIWSLVFTSLGVARGGFLISMNWTRPYLMTVTLGGVTNVVLNLLLIPRYGGMGAVIASLVAYWVATHGSCFVYRPLVPTGRMLTRALLWPRF